MSLTSVINGQHIVVNVESHLRCPATIKTVKTAVAAGEAPPSSSRDLLWMMVFNVSDDKQRCICNRQLLPQLVRPLPVQTGHLIPVWARRCPVSVPSHLQLGGTLVPRSTRHCLPPLPQLQLSKSSLIKQGGAYFSAISG